MSETHTVLVLCVVCRYKWVGNVLTRTSLFKLECPRCGEFNSFASFIPPEYLAAIEDMDDEEIQEETDHN